MFIYSLFPSLQGTRISPINGTRKPFIRILSNKKLW